MTIPFSQEIKKNTTKSGTMDYKSFSYLTYMGSRDNHCVRVEDSEL